MADLESPQTERNEGEAVDRLTICSAVHLLPEAHQQAGGRRNRTVGVSETHMPNRADMGSWTLRCNRQ